MNSNKDIIKANLTKMIDVNTPVIYIHDYDYTRVDFLLIESLGGDILEWSPAFGYQKLYKTTDGSLFRDDYSVDKSLEDVLSGWLKDIKSKPKYLLLRDIHEYLNEVRIKSLIQMIAQRKLYDLDFDLTLIINCPIVNVPPEIEKYVSFLEIPYPSEDEIKALIDQHLEINNTNLSTDSKENLIKTLMPSFKGMTFFEIDRMLDMAMSSGGTLTPEDKDMILRHKKQIVKKSGILDLIDTDETMDNIGGLNTLKTYLVNKAKIINDITKAEAFGVNVPKGIFIVGMPGCGKSLCAKAAASLFGCPLLKLDMGSLMGKYLGESEKNLRQAIKIAEAAAPCILWIDEIEKAFTGVGGSEVLTRMFGYFLSWLQEKKSSVYVIATANNANNLPPELKRKGRFDEIFFVDLPDNNERKEIFKVHLKKRNKYTIEIGKDLIDNEIPNDLIVKTNGFNGADIESVINEAIEVCFIKSINEKPIKLTYQLLIDSAKSTKSISILCKKQIEEMRTIFTESQFTNAK